MSTSTRRPRRRPQLVRRRPGKPMRCRRKPELPKSVDRPNSPRPAWSGTWRADHRVRARLLPKQPIRQFFGLAEGAQVPASNLFGDETQAFPRDAVLELVREEAIVPGSEHGGRHAG